MNELLINCCLSEETRLGTILIKGKIYDEHKGLGDNSKNYYITKHRSYDVIYAVFTREIYDLIFN